MPINVIDVIESKNNGDFPVVADTSLFGGFRSVADIAARDAIPTQRRVHGMQVFVQSTGETYQLGTGLTDGYWTLLSTGASISNTRDLYVDTGGDDAAPGTISEPIATIFEATLRTKEPAGLWNVWLNDGDHELRDVRTDFGNETTMRNRFAAYHPIKVEGVNKTAGTSITILSYVDNVATISETLTPSALVGQFVDHLLFASLEWRSYVLDNTANTITFMDQTTGWGGYFDSIPAVGAHVVQDHAARIVQPTTNPDEYENQLYIAGYTKLKNLTVRHDTSGFDIAGVTVAHGESGGNKGSSAGTYATLEKVKITGAGEGMHCHNAGINLFSVLIDCENSQAGQENGFQGEQGGNLTSSNTHIANADTAFIFGADFHGEVGVADSLYTPGVNDVIKVRAGGSCFVTISFNYTTTGAVRFCDIQGNGSEIGFSGANIAGFQQQGTNPYSSIFFADNGRKLSLYSLSGAATASPIGTPVYVDVDGESFTLAEWSALTRNVETPNGCRVTGSGKSGIAHFGVNKFDTILHPTRTEVGAYTATLTDSLILCDATGGAFSVDLPSAASAEGKKFTIKKIDAGAFAVTVDADGAETIDDALTTVLATQHAAVTVESDGTEWWIVSTN